MESKEGSHLNTQEHKKAEALLVKCDWLLGPPKGDVEIDSEGTNNWRLSLRGKRRYPTTPFEQPNGMPGLLRTGRIAKYWGRRMNEFGTKVHFRLLQQNEITLNHGKKNVTIPVSRIKCCIPAMAE